MLEDKLRQFDEEFLTHKQRMRETSEARRRQFRRWQSQGAAIFLIFLAGLAVGAVWMGVKLQHTDWLALGEYIGQFFGAIQRGMGQR